MYNDQRQKTRRQELRRDQTRAENILWQKIRNQQINDLKKVLKTIKENVRL